MMKMPTANQQSGETQISSKRAAEGKSRSSVEGKRAKISKPQSPHSTTFQNDELICVRNQNKILTEALKAIGRESRDHMKGSYGIVWYARNRMRYPLHPASKHIEQCGDFKEVLEDLRGSNAEYRYGVDAAKLAAARLFSDYASFVDSEMNDDEKVEANNGMMEQVLKQVAKEADGQIKRSTDMIWFAHNRLRFPTHDKTIRIERSKEYKDDVQNLRGEQGEYHYGFNEGILEVAKAVRKYAVMNESEADVPSLDSDSEDKECDELDAGLPKDFLAKIKASKNSFPNISAEDFPDF